jgi:hypothetical protein
MSNLMDSCDQDRHQEEFEDTKGVIRIRISKKNRQHNGQKKKYKRTNNDLQNIHIKLKSNTNHTKNLEIIRKRAPSIYSGI